MEDTVLQMTSIRSSRNNQTVHRFDSDLSLTPLHTSLHELVCRFDPAPEIDILDGHRDGLERNHERVHRAAQRLAPEYEDDCRTYPNMAYTPCRSINSSKPPLPDRVEGKKAPVMASVSRFAPSLLEPYFSDTGFICIARVSMHR
jgi:hypothetical protein